MKKSKLLMVVMAMVLTLALVATACGTTTTTTTAATTKAATTTAAATTAGTTAAPTTTGIKYAAKQEAVFNLGSEPPQLNSILTTDVTSFTVLRHLLVGLLGRDQTDALIPGMAESWTVSTDGLVYTFKLRDAKWSNGDAVTANDFAFAFRTLLAKETAAEYGAFIDMIKNAKEFYAGKAKVEDVGIKVVDDKTLEITLATPTAYFLELLPFGVLMPVNEKFYKQVGADKYFQEPNAMLFNGPYTVTKWEHDVEIVLEKNPNYYNKDAIKLTKITGKMINNSQTAFTSFLNGDLQMVGLADSNQVAQAKEKNFKPATYSDGSSWYLQLNLTSKVSKAMSNAKIRTAIALALNRADFCEKILKNNSLPALSYTPPSIRGLDGKSFQSMVGNILKDNSSAEAKALYAEGLKEIGATSVEMSFISDSSDRAVLFANAIASYLKANLGLTLKVEPMDFKSRLARMTAQEYDMVYAGWGPDYNEPMTFLDLWTSTNPNNDTGYASTEYDALILKARQTADEKARFAIYLDAEKLLLKDLPIIPVYFRIRDYVTTDSLKGVIRSDLQDISFIYAYIAG